MGKVFTQIPLHNHQQVKPESLNKNIDKYLSSFNGTLDGHNNPVDSTTTTHFVDPTASTSLSDTGVGADVFKRGTEYPTQSYYQTRRSSSFEPTVTDVWTPIVTLDLDTGQWSKGFNILTELPDFENFPLTFEAVEGQLVGCATVDWEHGNNVLVARSGFIYPRRHTTQIPFTIPVGSQSVTIDVRFITTTNRALGSPSLEVTSSEFNIFSAEIWVRNQYR
jgi:hypothetical protein